MCTEANATEFTKTPNPFRIAFVVPIDTIK
jgi:hypothetical protein